VKTPGNPTQKIQKKFAIRLTNPRQRGL